MSNKYVDYLTALTFLSNVTNSILINLIELHVTNASFIYTVHRKEAALFSCIALYNLLVRGIYLNAKSCSLSGPINYDSERSIMISIAFRLSFTVIQSMSNITTHWSMRSI